MINQSRWEQVRIPQTAKPVYQPGRPVPDTKYWVQPAKPSTPQRGGW